MKSILTIIKKEFSRFFKDKRMILTIFIPGLLIFVLYSLMGAVTDKMGKTDEDYKPSAVIINLPSELSVPFSTLLNISDEQIDEEQAKIKVEEGALDVLIVFPENFDLSNTEIGEIVPNINLYFNSSPDNSVAGYAVINATLEAIKKTSFTVNSVEGIKYDLATESDTVTKILSRLVPMLMFSLIASACVSFVPESIAGEKERGTMATILITPIKRWKIALGKIISLSCFAMLSGLSSFIGVILSLPKLVGGMGLNLTSMPYGFGDYFAIFALIISVTLVIVSSFSVLSTLSKNVKEAGAFIGPIMMVIILLGVVSMFFTNPHVALCAIPLLGSGLAITEIMLLTASSLGVALAIISNLVLTAGFVVLLGFMFKSEKIMFKK